MAKVKLLPVEKASFTTDTENATGTNWRDWHHTCAKDHDGKGR